MDSVNGMPFWPRRARLHFAAAGVHAGQPYRSQRHRHRQLLAEQRGLQAEFGHIAQHALAQGNIGQICGIALQRMLRVGPAVDVVKQKRRQFAGGGPVVG
ncbi:hypothetical protein M8494_00205 [Serratia ureilytica]